MPRPKITIEERVGKVYKITSPSGKIYIGSTYQWINARWCEYYAKRCVEQPKLLKSLNKYGPEAHTFEVIWEGDWKDMYKMERLYGEQFEVLGRNGLNCQLPGYEDVPGLVSEGTRKKLSQASKNIIKPRLTKEQRSNLAEAQKRITERPSRKGFDSSKKVPILVYTASGEFLQEVGSVSEASKVTRCSASSVVQCCKNPGTTRKGFTFKYKPHLIASSEIMQIDPYSDMVLFIWDSASDAASFLDINSSGINQCANGNTKTSMGFKWKFVDPNFDSSKYVKTKKPRKLKKKLPPEFYKEKAKLNYKPINMYTIEGEYVREFPSLKEAAEVIGLKNSTPIIGICKKCKGIAKGYQFRYKVDESKEPIPPYERKNKAKPKVKKQL